VGGNKLVRPDDVCACDRLAKLISNFVSGLDLERALKHRSLPRSEKAVLASILFFPLRALNVPRV
jgi:hypothetical protein